MAYSILGYSSYILEANFERPITIGEKKINTLCVLIIFG